MHNVINDLFKENKSHLNYNDTNDTIIITSALKNYSGLQLYYV